jgi:pyridoxal phosphate enzyme (YggS family)
VSESEQEARRAEIAANWAAVRQRIGAACEAVARSPEEVTVVAVTKTFPATDIGHLAALGLHDVGENRHQDAAPKVAECAAAGIAGLRWHFVGQVQTNKAAAVCAYADVVHAVDRVRLVDALDRGAEEHGRVVTALVQVRLDVDPDPDAGRGGATPAELPEVAAAFDAAGSLVLGGLMAVAPLGGDPREAFARLALLASELRTSYPEAVIVSAGMSADLEAAIEHGATHLRVGTALLGSRPPLG